MKKLTLLFVVAAFASLTAAAQKSAGAVDKATVFKPYINRQLLEPVKGADGAFMAMRRSTPPKADAKQVTVKFASEHDDWSFMVNTVFVYNEQTSLITNRLMLGEDTAEIVLPAGTYDVACSYTDFMTMRKYYYDIKELLDFTKDTVVVFNTEEITERVKFRPVSPQGDVWNVSVVDNTTGVEKTGNAKRMGIMANVVLENVGALFGTMSDCEMISGLNSVYEGADFYVNKVSDRYHFLSSFITIGNDDNIYVNRFNSTLSQIKDSVKSDPAGYVQYQDEVKLNKNEDFTDEYYGGYITYEYLNGQLLSGWVAPNIGIATEPDKTIKFFIDAPMADENDAMRYDIMLAPTVYNLERHEEDGVVQETSFPNIGKPFVIKDGKPYYYFICNDDFQLEDFKESDGLTVIDGFPGLVPMSYSADERSGMEGNSMPIMNLFMRNNENRGNYFEWSIAYYGRLGEQMRSGWKNLDIDLKFNGEDILCKDYGEFMQFAKDYSNNGWADGVLDCTVTTAERTVDDVKGRNVTRLYADFTKEDHILPTLKMLQFRNGDNVVTDRFETPADGRILLTAVDNQFEYETSVGLICSIQPVSVDVEYAPAGSGDWRQLPVDENADYSSVNFGYFYEGSLQGVQGGDGWYDLKVKVTDMSGNYQEQTITPAFKIGETSGIQGVDVHDVAGRVNVYNLQGQCVATGVERSSLNLAKGIYIIKGVEGGTAKKVQVR